jgi:hypothetical protein
MSILSDIGAAAEGIIGAIAPTAATLLGGPLAGLATQKLVTVLGLAPKASPAEIGAALQAATPEQLVELKKIDATLETELKKLDIDLYTLQTADTANARQREIAVRDYTPRILAGCVMGLYIGVQFWVLAYTLEASQMNIVMRSLGTLDAAVGLVLGYYFGSSLGSSNKDKQISNLADKLN